MSAGVCKTCGAAVLWVQLLPRGTNAPLDVQPAPNGNIRLSPGRQVGKVLGKLELAGARARHESLYLNHFATCPQAASHRKG